MSDPPVPTAGEYGARFAGFVRGFVDGYGADVRIVPDHDAQLQLLRAAVSAWDDYLVRQRRTDKRLVEEQRLGVRT